MGAIGHRSYNIQEYGVMSPRFAEFHAATGMSHGDFLESMGKTARPDDFQAMPGDQSDSTAGRILRRRVYGNGR